MKVTPAVKALIDSANEKRVRVWDRLEIDCKGKRFPIYRGSHRWAAVGEKRNKQRRKNGRYVWP